MGSSAKLGCRYFKSISDDDSFLAQINVLRGSFNCEFCFIFLRTTRTTTFWRRRGRGYPSNAHATKRQKLYSKFRETNPRVFVLRSSMRSNINVMAKDWL